MPRERDRADEISNFGFGIQNFESGAVEETETAISNWTTVADFETSNGV